MVKFLQNQERTIDSKNICIECDEEFASETDFKDHILTTLHSGPSKSTRNFKYRVTDKTARTNLMKGAKRKHLGIEIKQGATNIDFSDGSWILVAYPEMGN